MKVRNQKATGRGGPGRGQGRKRDPLKDLRTGASTALKMLAELDHEQKVLELYKGSKDEWFKIHVIFKLREWGYGKPTDKMEVSGGDKPIGVVAAHVDLSKCSDADLIRAEELVRKIVGKAAEPGADS